MESTDDVAVDHLCVWAKLWKQQLQDEEARSLNLGVAEVKPEKSINQKQYV